MKDNNWWQVKNLKKHEEVVLKTKNIDDLEKSGMGDFGSYRKILKGENIQNTMLASHNDLNSKNKILFINKLLPFKNNDELKKEFDEYNFETHRVPHAKIIGFFGNNFFSILVDKILRFILR